MAFIDSREAVKVKRSVVMPVSRRLRRRYGALHKECVELYTHRETHTDAIHLAGWLDLLLLLLLLLMAEQTSRESCLLLVISPCSPLLAWV